MLDPILPALPLLPTALLLGGMVFFAFVFAPLVFIKLPEPTAGGFIRQVFPVYYRVSILVAAVAAIAAWGRVEAFAMAGVVLAFLFAWLWLMPRINRARDASHGDPAAARRFARLHRTSVLINGLQLVVVLIVFVRLAG